MFYLNANTRMFRCPLCSSNLSYDKISGTYQIWCPRIKCSYKFGFSPFETGTYEDCLDEISLSKTEDNICEKGKLTIKVIVEIKRYLFSF